MIQQYYTTNLSTNTEYHKNDRVWAVSNYNKNSKNIDFIENKKQDSILADNKASIHTKSKDYLPWDE